MPYEIFTGPKDLDVFPIPSSVTEGVIIKVKQENEHSRYDFRYIDSYGYTNTLGGLSRIFDKEYWNYGRLVSGLLRSRIPVEQVVKIVDGLKNLGTGTGLKQYEGDGDISDLIAKQREEMLKNIDLQNPLGSESGSGKKGGKEKDPQEEAFKQEKQRIALEKKRLQEEIDALKEKEDADLEILEAKKRELEMQTNKLQEI